MTNVRRTKLAGGPAEDAPVEPRVPAGALRHAIGGDSVDDDLALSEPTADWVTPDEVARATANVATLSRWAIRQIADSADPEVQVRALQALRAAVTASHDLPVAVGRAMKPPPRPPAAPVLAASEMPVTVYRTAETLPPLDYDDDLRAAALAVLAEED